MAVQPTQKVRKSHQKRSQIALKLVREREERGSARFERPVFNDAEAMIFLRPIYLLF